MMALGSQRRWLGCLALASALDVVTHDTLRATTSGPTGPLPLPLPFFPLPLAMVAPGRRPRRV
jgi:hypothetical protein